MKNIKKKVIILIGSISVISVIIIVVTVLQHPSPKPSASPTPVSTITPGGTSGPQGAQELPSDLKYGQALTAITDQYPWYPKLPIENKDYQIVYDFDKQEFRIRIKSVSVSAADVKTITQSALNALISIGVQEPINYYILDANGNQL
jgi:hypothetical protein